ncbi:unnamed protein product [Musa acuminata subsp. malaccensis]|uniref:(wild Malaysian banana) hypothetical protein n=1 Tax=Musa acuminata subsp. malaccensis TaxID=214687 RepID=A0A804IGK4_MUSAM|nr:unnamed protein product [Musa acuminata subsp. malaccensis]
MAGKGGKGLLATKTTRQTRTRTRRSRCPALPVPVCSSLLVEFIGN